MVRVETPWISAGEDEVFLTVIYLKVEVTWTHGGVNKYLLFASMMKVKLNQRTISP